MTTLKAAFLHSAWGDDATISQESDTVDPRAPRVILGREQSLFVTQDKKNPGKRCYRLFIDKFIGGEAGTMHQIHNCLLDAQAPDTLEVRLNNYGGVVSEGVRLIHVMENSFHERTTTVLECNAMSMAAVVFVKGTIRVVHPLSRLMFHNYSSGVIGKGGEISDVVDQENSTRDKLYEEILAKGWLTQEEYRRMLDGKDIYLEFEDLVERGIATHVMDKGDCVPVDEY